MQGADLLLVGTEVSVAFAGFAGIIATFQAKGDKQISRGDFVGLDIVVNFGLGGAFFSALPLVLSLFGMREVSVWSFSSLIFGFWLSYHIFHIFIGLRGSGVNSKTIPVFALLFVISALSIGANFANAAGIYFDSEPGPYVATIMLGLFLVGYSFARLLLRPLRKSVAGRISETDSPVS
jgi:hypothetical protein